VRARYWALACCALLVITGCGHRERLAAAPPPPPIAAAPAYPEQGQETSPEQLPTDRPIYSEIGIASWYGPPYNNRRGANGKIYDQNAITAAHRTLPLGSLIRVTNLQTGKSAMMHVTDRGPFVPGRILDLSLGAAKELGVWRTGTARVRIDVYATPKSIREGGRWCVQIGAFSHAGTAKKLEKHLAREYESASVIEFTGPTGHWVRIRPKNGDKSRAIQIVRNIRIKEGAAYLVRLD
jgi:rare lipoprotein A